MEQNFFSNLEPFILSGKLKNTPIPGYILNRLIGYYKQKDIELLEKSLLNLDLSKYSNILEIRHICETEFLTSALIHLLTNLFDNDDEVNLIVINISYRVPPVCSYFALCSTSCSRARKLSTKLTSSNCSLMRDSSRRDPQ